MTRNKTRIALYVFIIGFFSISLFFSGSVAAEQPEMTNYVNSADIVMQQQGDFTQLELCGGDAEDSLAPIFQGFLTLLLYASAVYALYAVAVNQAGDSINSDMGSGDSASKVAKSVLLLWIVVYFAPFVIGFLFGFDLRCLSPNFPPGT